MSELLQKNNLKILLTLVGAQLILAVLIIVGIGFYVEDTSLGKGTVEEPDVTWTLSWEDGRVSEVPELPYNDYSRADEVVTLSTDLPDSYQGRTLFFLSADKFLTVYIDGNEIYEFGENDKRLFGHTPGSVTNFVDLPGDWEQGHLEIKMHSPYVNYATYLTKIYVARRDVAVLSLLRNNLFKLFCSIVMLFVGLTMILLAIVQMMMKMPTDGMGYIGSLYVFAAVYYAIETKAMILVFGNSTLASFLVFSFMMTFPLLLINYYSKIAEVRIRSAFNAVLILAYLDIVVQLILQGFNIKDFMLMASWPHILLIFSVLVALSNFAIIMIKENSTRYMVHVLALFCLLAGGVADLLTTSEIKVGDLAVYSRIGTTLYSVVLLLWHIRQIAKNTASEMEKNLITISETNKRLQESERIADEANRAKSEFLSRMSHEIRTPINAILGMNEMILRESDQDSVLGYATTIEQSGAVLQAIINDVLDISKIESGAAELDPEDFDINSLLNDVYHMTAPKAGAKELELIMVTEDYIPAKINGDMQKMRQILINLVTNGIKYTDKGRVTVTVSCRTTENKLDVAEFIFTVKDTGIGIREENLDKLFQKFTRLDMQRNQSIEGTGLGLVITRELTELMGGKITVSSEYGMGTTFTVKMPFIVVDNRQMEKISFNNLIDKNVGKKDRKTFKAPNARILVVDDMKVNLMVFVNLLKHTGMTIDTATGGEQCLRMISMYHYDIVFMDHMMPQMDGVETFRRMGTMEGSLNGQTPVIMLTANALSGVKEEYLNEGFADYLAKPIVADKLEAMIVKYLPEGMAENC